MSITRILKIALIIEIIVLSVTAAAISRDYQDSWILEGLEIPFVVFIITYVAYVFIENKISWIVLFALIFRSVILLLPNLKYTWFEGTAIDQQMHYRFVNDIRSSGHVPAGWSYSGTPDMQLYFAIYSSVTNIPVRYAFNYLPILSWLAYPLCAYMLMRLILHSSFSMKNSSSPLKYAVFISSIPIKATTSYIVVGTLFGGLLAFLFLSQLVRLSETKNREDWIILMILGITLVGTHSYSSVILLFGLFITYLALKINYIKRKFKIFGVHALNSNFLIFLFILNVGWLFYAAFQLVSSSLSIIIHNFIDAMLGIEVHGFPTTGIQMRFFELNLMDKLRIVLVFHGVDIFLLLLSLFAIILAVRRMRSSRSLMLLSFYFTSIWLFFVAQILLGSARAGLLEYNRVIEHSLLLSPVFISIVLFHFNKKTRTRAFSMFIIAMFLVLTPLALFGCQPLVPSANVISKDLPSDEPVVYVSGVNSIYQRNMIQHAEKYIGNGVIASDATTRNQIIGLTNYNFSHNHLLWYYPFSPLLDKNINEEEYDYFLIHLPGKSGKFEEKAEIRTRSLILGAISNSSIIYSNGESYILTKPFMYSVSPHNSTEN